MENVNNSVVGYYDDYLEKVMEVARLTTKDNSVLLSFNIEDGKCQSKVEMIELDGTRGAVKCVNFACTDAFYSNFLEKLVREYAQSTKIILTDIIDIDGDNQFTFRMVGESNDLFSVDGISKDYALKLKEISEQFVSDDSKSLVKVPDEAGISNSMGLVMLGLLMTIIVLTLTLFKI